MTIVDRAEQAADYARAGFGQELQPGTVLRWSSSIPPVPTSIPTPRCMQGGGERRGDAHPAHFRARGRNPGGDHRGSPARRRCRRGVFFKKSGTLVAFCEGSPYGELIEGLEPTCAEMLVTKKYPSAFFGTTLNSHLTSLGVDTVLIAGLSTSGCVRATTLDAMQHGFVPIVVEDAVGDRDPAIHSSNLFDMQQKMAEVWPLGRAQEYLETISARN